MTDLKAPFVWFGGKRKVSRIVWDYFGDVQNYAEPFAGSLAVLLGRPSHHKAGAETVNDLDKYICNFWRALAADPDAVAHHADWPVNETDLFARHIWLVNEGRASLAKLDADPDYYDAKVAGWWVWGINSWIGSGWCSGNGPWQVVDGEAVLTDGDGGVKKQRPHLMDKGRGVNRQRPHLGNRGQDKPGKETDSDSLRLYMRQLAERLRGVRVCSGDWKRIVTNGALSYGDTVGIFLDPPYAQDIRQDDLYNHESPVSAEVREWAIANGSNPRYRIALCGYDGEHVMPADWRVVEWKANASYQGANSNGGNKDNRHKERIWFSPNCLVNQETLFANGVI